jgi:hypothetical protein
MVEKISYTSGQDGKKQIRIETNDGGRVNTDELKFDPETDEITLSGNLPPDGRITICSGEPASAIENAGITGTKIRAKPIKGNQPVFMIASPSQYSVVVSGFGYRDHTNEFTLTGRLPPKSAITIEMKSTTN